MRYKNRGERPFALTNNSCVAYLDSYFLLVVIAVTTPIRTVVIAQSLKATGFYSATPVASTGGTPAHRWLLSTQHFAMYRSYLEVWN
jgi:hypothetical protein